MHIQPLRHCVTVASVLGLMGLVAACAPAQEPPPAVAEESPAVENEKSPIEGVWDLVKTTMPDGTEVPNQAGRLVFLKTHYIAAYDRAPEPRPSLPEGGAANATADELRASYGGFNSATGTYEWDGEEVTVRDEIALANGRTASDAFLVLSAKVDGDTYTTSPLRTHAGPSPGGVTFHFTRVE